MGIQPNGSFWGHLPHQPRTINIRKKKIHLIGITGDPWARGKKESTVQETNMQTE